ncbi:hypothetical protein D3C71_960330 [compost metagenome]
MPGAALMRAQRPCCRTEVEVVVLRLFTRGRIAQRQHEGALLAGVAHQRRRQVMRCRRRGAFGFTAQAHLQRTLRHVDDALLADDRIDGVDHTAIVRFELVVVDLVLLQRADHRSVVVRISDLQPLGLHHQRCQLAHHRAGFHVLQLRTLHQQRRVDVHTHFLELERVQLGRQAGVGARVRQHLLLRPGDVILHLRGQLGQRGVGAFDLVLGKQLADAGDVGIDVGQCLVDFDLRRLQQVRRAAFFFITLARQRGHRLRARRLAEIGLEAIQCLGPARRRHLVGKQVVEATEHGLRHIHPRHQVLLVERAAFDVALGGADHDFQILAHVRVAFELQFFAQLIARLAQRGAVAAGVVRAEIGNLVVVPRHTEEAGHFRLERRLRLQQDLRQFVAVGNPGGRSRSGLGGGRGGGHVQRQRCGESEDNGKDERFHAQLLKSVP